MQETVNTQPFIEHAMPEDIAVVCRLFEEAIAFQRQNHYIGWKSFDQSFIERDIQKGLLYKIVNGGQLMSVFSICLSDELIWREKEKGDAIYLHRIILNQRFKGEKVFIKIFDWAIAFAKQRQLKYIRMDTWAENSKLISYYKTYGFYFIENYHTGDTKELPVQHRNLNVALLEYMVTG
ncbi:MAG: N-acetyltransferase [Chitinophagaceae bacterium]|nr:N-acetyltransferase [Chitinophagaceae bacterium]